MGLSAGTRLGPYEILSPLGAGGMGEVYRAKDTKLGREVAVKVLHGEFLENKTSTSRQVRVVRRYYSSGITKARQRGKRSARLVHIMRIIVCNS
jgi:serine/threonine protein kinase